VDNRNWRGIFPWQRAVREDSLPTPKRCCGEIPIESVWSILVEGWLGSFTLHSDVKLAATLAERLKALGDEGRGFFVPEIQIRRDEGGPSGVNDRVLALLELGKRRATCSDLSAALEVDESDFVELGADAQDKASQHLNSLLAPSGGGAQASPFVFEFHPVFGSLDSQKIGNDSPPDPCSNGYAGHSILRLAEKFLVALDASIGENTQDIIGEFVVADCALAVDYDADCCLKRLGECRLQGAVGIGAFAYNFDFMNLASFLGDASEGSRVGKQDRRKANLPDSLHR
jgi:hypothetical protein